MDREVQRRKISSDYMNAAAERIDSAFKLLEQSSFVLAIYIAGVAVECVFRAYHARRSLEFDSRHDLFKWSIKSGFDRVIKPIVLSPEQQNVSETFVVALNELTKSWPNSYRYYSEKSLLRCYLKHYNCTNEKELLSHFHKSKHAYGKTNPLQPIADQIYGAAKEIYDLGKLKWTNWLVN
jgi:hypothetical protein